AVLVRALEVEVGGEPQLRPLLEHGRMAHARVEPDVEDVALLAEALPAARRAAEAGRQQLLRRPREPGVRALALEDRSDVLRDLLRQVRLAARLAVDGDDRNAPQALARDAPVGPGGDHPVDPVAAPRRDPLHALDLGERALAEPRLLHRHEPLLGAAEEERVLAAPAVGVAVPDRALRDQRAGPLEDLDDAGVRVEDLLAGELRHLGREPAGG